MMFEEVSELSLAQEDGGPPTALAAGREAGENGVFVLDGAAHLSATPRRHHVCFQISQQSRFDCHIADQRLSHLAQSVGMTPHRYIVQLHLWRAAQLMHDGQMKLA